VTGNDDLVAFNDNTVWVTDVQGNTVQRIDLP
jgi:hypothetical protein